MAKNSNNQYWLDRRKDDLKNQLSVAEEIIKQLSEYFKVSLEEIKKEISYFFQLYATENKLEYNEAVKKLSGEELYNYAIEYDKLMKKENAGLPTADIDWKNIAIKSKITRLDKLALNISKILYDLYLQQEKSITTLLQKSYIEQYYKSIYDIQTFKGYYNDLFTKPSKRLITQIIKHPWSGTNYSDNIWKNKAKLEQVLKDKLVKMINQGKPLEEISKELGDIMNVPYNNAKSLVNTEHAYICEKATMDSYNDLEVDKYEFLATLDTRTSKTCKGLDGKIFETSKAYVGTNYPPMHVNCRSTTIPVIDDYETEDERIAKDKENNNIIIGKITYKEWYKKYIEEED